MKFLLLLVLIAALCGCSEKPKEPPKEYVMQGEVLRLDPSGQLATVKHGKIEGWMEAMTMDYPVKDKAEFENLKVGEKIAAKVTVAGTDYFLSEIKPDASAEAAPPEPTEKKAVPGKK